MCTIQNESRRNPERYELVNGSSGASTLNEMHLQENCAKVVLLINKIYMHVEYCSLWITAIV